MEAGELLKKVRKIEIKTRRLSKHLFAGEYHSAFKGKGMTFSEVREYLYGDAIRDIDWNVTARFNHPYVKIYEEERELTVMLIIDVSASKIFGTSEQLKEDLITEISAVLSFSAILNNDKIGVIFFSNTIEKFIPPQKGRTHILRIIRELIEFKPEHKETNIAEALGYFTNVIKKKCTAFLISDFIDTGYEDAIKIANKKHDLIALKIYDERETKLPPIGLVKMKDAETGDLIWVDTSSKKVRRNYEKWWNDTSIRQKEIFSKAGVDSVAIRTDEDYVRPLMKLFKKR
ncbi:MAG: DUF58 domain-containing protein [Bacteroidota bacterium]|nr:DUF58 domain-containing protein [Bacteroidota bacterium]